MPHKRYEEMDQWSSKEVANFKEHARYKANTQPDIHGFEAAHAAPMIVAEGDSWFNYLPGTDLIDCLREHHHYRIDKYAEAGDTLENMVYGTRIDNSFQPLNPTIDRVLARIAEVQPKVFLFSGGGNDIAGDEFESYLNHQASGLPVLRENFVEYMIDQVFRQCFVDLIAKVSTKSPGTHIVAHGYGHTEPTGRGVQWALFRFAGPWLRPALARKGIFDSKIGYSAVVEIIDRYNAMLSNLASAHTGFHHVDLRPVLDPAQDWANELHLRNSAFARAAEKIHQSISAIP